jgi:RNA recognition motif-containing protein
MVTRTKKIFVGGLSAPTTLEDVKSYFEQFGPVSRSPQIVVVVVDWRPGAQKLIQNRPEQILLQTSFSNRNNPAIPMRPTRDI